MTTTPILVTGGTGTLGRHIVPMLRAADRSVRVLSRQRREPADDGVEYVTGDLLADTGVGPAVAGVHTVLHLAGSNKGDDVATANLVRAAAAADVRHLVVISVIGADTVPLGFLRTKLAAERAVADSGVPWTVLRAAQFHDLALTMAKAMAKLPVVPVPSGMRLQPVDARDVAARLAELTLGAPAGRVPDLAGPAVYPLADLVRSYLAARAKRRPLLPFPLPGKAGRAYRTGANLTLEGADHGTRTWEDFLSEKLG
ncbi:SDR family oxidoreductase [Actinacidiphila bryophytorum]|uniref:NAD-dependent epimerase/dehydratase family protein n=1 Tax=Actinacidiphila bryophytorum TaxID=1436133 RepID=A0A9W4GY38_9ACTN|nr:NAD(P)H-binding protein [Actinacidiphila bryophytorum]MBM9438936.1 NAD(P)H-binding protein [Actinacidiphila bryophytorum]MBN6547348.1 NAD(P)H-binding protein [Actinacidiphila bryophytorum]CAG7616283.1 NAD-dependent epimerase/dehydratase family protein [Actinacidiphila bryophytorum]